MNRQRNAFIGALVAVVTAACGPTDEGIGTKVKTNLTADETVKAAQVDVGVQKKIVTLSGTVDTPAIQQRAVAVARGTDGVADVVDRMMVKEQGSGLAHGHGSGPGHAPGMAGMPGMGMMDGKDRPGEAKR